MVDKIRNGLIKSLHDAKNTNSVVDVSSVDKTGIGHKTIHSSSLDDESFKKGIHIELLPIVSDNFASYQLIMQILGPEYSLYSNSYMKQFLYTARISLLPPEIIQYIIMRLSTIDTINFCTVFPICEDDIFWKNKLDRDFTTINDLGLVIKPSSNWNSNRRGFDIYKAFHKIQTSINNIPQPKPRKLVRNTIQPQPQLQPQPQPVNILPLLPQRLTQLQYRAIR